MNYLIFQVGSYPGDYNTIKAANPYCRNVNLPANAECTEGWFFMSNDYVGRPIGDPTVGIDCLGIYPYPILSYFS